MSHAPTELDLALRLADDWMDRGFRTEAVEQCRWVAAVLWQRGEFAKALPVYMKIAQALPQCLHTRAMIAECYRMLGHTDHAAATYEEIAQIHAAAGRFEEALAVYEIVLGFGPEQAWRRLRYADLLAHLGRHEASWKQLERAAEDLRKLGSREDYVRVLEQRLRVGPDDRALRSSLVRACLKLDQLPAAAFHLQAMLNAAPADPAATVLYAELYARRGQPQLAADTVCAVARKLIRRQRHERAARLLRRALTWVPDHPESLRLLRDLEEGRDVTEIAEGKAQIIPLYPRPRAMTLHADEDDIISGQFFSALR